MSKMEVSQALYYDFYIDNYPYPIGVEDKIFSHSIHHLFKLITDVYGVPLNRVIMIKGYSVSNRKGRSRYNFVLARRVEGTLLKSAKAIYNRKFNNKLIVK